MLPLHQLARLYRVETGYWDVFGQRKLASPEALLETLRGLGAPLASMDDVPQAIRERRLARWRRPLEPVAVLWEGRPERVAVHVPGRGVRGVLRLRCALESGEVRSSTVSLNQLRTLRAVEIEGERFEAKELPLPGPLPFGYHQLSMELAGAAAESRIFVAPRKAYRPAGEPQRVWGAFLPLYALCSQTSWGAGDFSDLERFAEWLAERGARAVSTVPFLAAFLEEPFDPSPYAPASRLFWNEFYVDVRRASELSRCPEAQALLNSTKVEREIDLLRADPLVDYRRVMALKRKIIEPLARSFFEQLGDRSDDYRRFLASHPRVEDYASFRAAADALGPNWRDWPAAAREGWLETAHVPAERRRHHIYAQWLAHQQIASLTEKTRRVGMGLYLDVPLGAHPDGYDVWREREAFALGLSTGAPPDTFFSLGQDWGFPPIHPERIREQGYRYVIESFRHQMEPAELLRIDHVMGLHRLFWIPRGMEPRQGVYVRYRAEELYAILILESHRRGCALVGENLGTVPDKVNHALARHDIRSMYVLQFQIRPDPGRALSPVPPDAVASLNTHDTPTFEGFRRGLDIEDRIALSLLDEARAPAEREGRQALVRALAEYLPVKEGGLVRACLTYLAASPAPVVLLSVEDLWLETNPQNVPGLTGRPNWRQKARHAFDAFCQMPEVVETMEQVNFLRKG